MKRYLIVAGAIAMTALVGECANPVTAAFAGDQLTLVNWGGADQDASRDAFYKPFSKETGIKVTDVSYSGEAAKIRAMVESGAVSWDVVNGWAKWASQMCADGMLEKIDWNKLGLDRSKFIDGDKFECGVPIAASAAIVAYDSDKLPNGPTTIADLFDLKKFPGKRGLYKGARLALEWAVIADGVPTADVYKVLATPEGVERAFKKLDTIKRDIVWWTIGAQPQQLLAGGDVVMTAAYNPRITAANKDSGKHFRIMWDAQLWNVGNIWVIPRGTPRLEDAYKFIAYAASPEVAARLSNYLPVGPANREALKYVDPAVLHELPTSPDHLTHALRVNDSFWSDQGDALDQRFNAWLAQ